MSIQIFTATGSVTITGDGVATVVGAPPSYIGTTPVFYPPKNPDQSPDIDSAPALLSVAFGDGYTQSSPKGINHIADTMSVAWSLLSLEEVTVMDAFFRERGGYQSFWYALPSCGLWQWKAPRWKRGGRGNVFWGFSASLARSFDPVV
jgi:phage-related protein